METTTYSGNDLKNEVSAALFAAIENNGIANPEWIVQQVISMHADISGSDVVFYRTLAYGGVRSEVRRQVNALKASGDNEVDPQARLEGYERLQKAYLVTRNKEQQLIRIDLLTIDELNEKIVEYRRMGEGIARHVDELQRYLALRLDSERDIA